MTTYKKPTCPACNSNDLEICLPAWFRFNSANADVDSTTMVSIDYEADGHVYCNTCESHHDTKSFYIEDTP